MTDDDRIEALLALVDPDRTADMDATRRLMVVGLAESAGRGYRPTTVGWVLLGDRGRRYNP
jgi:hypothetical protein